MQLLAVAKSYVYTYIVYNKMIVRCANIHKQKREGRWKMYHFLPFPSYFPCQVKNSIHFNPEIFKQPTFNPPQKLPNRAQDMRHWTFNCYSDPSTIINSDQMIKSLRPWLPCNMCRSIICYPLIKLGNSTKIQKAWFSNPNPPVYPNVQIPRFTVHMSPKKKNNPRCQGDSLRAAKKRDK